MEWASDVCFHPGASITRKASAFVKCEPGAEGKASSSCKAQALRSPHDSRMKASAVLCVLCVIWMWCGRGETTRQLCRQYRRLQPPPDRPAPRRTHIPLKLYNQTLYKLTGF